MEPSPRLLFPDPGRRGSGKPATGLHSGGLGGETFHQGSQQCGPYSPRDCGPSEEQQGIQQGVQHGGEACQRASFRRKAECSWRFRTKEVNLMKNRKERPNSELKKVTVRKDDWIQEMNGTKNGVITTDIESEEKEKGKNVSSGLKNGTVPSPPKRDSDQTLQDLINRDLPPPPETPQAAPPAPEGYDPMYDSVQDLHDRLAETRQNTAPSNTKVGTSISKSNNMTALENQEPQTLDQINPLYESADKVQDSPSLAKTKPELPKPEVTKEEGRKEPLYAVIRKDPSVKRPPPRNPGGEKSSNQDLYVLDEQRVDFIASKEQKSPNSQSPSDKVASMLNNCRKRSIKSAKPPKETTTVNITPEAPPLVPDKRFEIESEVEEYTIEEDTD